MKYEQERKGQEKKSLQDLQHKHKKQHDQLKNQHNDELNSFNDFWDKKI